MPGANFVYIWQYSIRPERKDEFLAAYNSDGDWTKLFSRDGNYIKTELLQDTSDENVYMTIDYWTSESARNAFREKYSEDFAELDGRCEAYTLHEALVGDFIIQEAGANAPIR